MRRSSHDRVDPTRCPRHSRSARTALPNRTPRRRRSRRRRRPRDRVTDRPRRARRTPRARNRTSSTITPRPSSTSRVTATADSRGCGSNLHRSRRSSPCTSTTQARSHEVRRPRSSTRRTRPFITLPGENYFPDGRTLLFVLVGSGIALAATAMSSHATPVESHRCWRVDRGRRSRDTPLSSPWTRTRSGCCSRPARTVVRSGSASGTQAEAEGSSARPSTTRKDTVCSVARARVDSSSPNAPCPTAPGVAIA